jgi:hypothetical protein
MSTTGLCILVWLMFLGASALWTLACVGVADVLRVPVTEAAVGYGPFLPSVDVAGIRCRLGLLPLGGHVRFLELSPDDPERAHGDVLRNRRLAVQLAVALLPWAVVFLGSVDLLGPGQALHLLGASYSVFLHPGVLGRGLSGWLTTVRGGEWSRAAGELLAWQTAINLLPLGSFAGAQLYLAPLQRVSPARAARLASRGTVFVLCLAVAMVAGVMVTWP